MRSGAPGAESDISVNLKRSAPAPPVSVSPPPPPMSVSLPPPPVIAFAAELPVMTLARPLPVPLIAAAPVRVRFSTLSASVWLTELRTRSVPSPGILNHLVGPVIDDIGVVAGAAFEHVVAEDVRALERERDVDRRRIPGVLDLEDDDFQIIGAGVRGRRSEFAGRTDPTPTATPFASLMWNSTTSAELVVRRYKSINAWSPASPTVNE